MTNNSLSVTLSIVSLILSVVIPAATVYVMLRRMGPQRDVDTATAVEKYYALVVQLQKEVEHFRAILKNSHLEVTMRIKLEEAPEVIRWKWVKEEEKAE